MKKITFEQNEQGGQWPECLSFLEGLGTDDNPFGCPYLRVLPCKVVFQKFERRGKPSRNEPGDLMCVERARYDISRRCDLGINPRINFDGDLQATCTWPLGDDFVIKLKK